MHRIILGFSLVVSTGVQALRNAVSEASSVRKPVWLMALQILVRGYSGVGFVIKVRILIHYLSRTCLINTPKYYLSFIKFENHAARKKTI
jgi:hypothetical protein